MSQSSSSAPGLVAVVQNPDAKTLAVLYREGIDYVLMPRFLIDQMNAIQR